MNDKSTVFIVDDDTAILESLTWLLQSHHYQVQSYTSAQKFLYHYQQHFSACLLLDVRMKSMDGLKLQERMTEQNIVLPIIFISGYGDIPTSVKAIKKGAFDFLTKPLDNKILLTTINEAIKNNDIPLNTDNIKQLTSREREVMGLMIKGKPTKIIARELGISPHTVELHRGKVLKKMQAQSVVELTCISNQYNLL